MFQLICVGTGISQCIDLNSIYEGIYIYDIEVVCHFSTSSNIHDRDGGKNNLINLHALCISLGSIKLDKCLSSCIQIFKSVECINTYHHMYH